MQDGGRRVVAITEVQRMESEVITLQDLYTFEVEGVARKHVVGSLKATGFRPSFAEKFERRGIEVPGAPTLAPARGAPVKVASRFERAVRRPTARA